MSSCFTLLARGRKATPRRSRSRLAQHVPPPISAALSSYLPAARWFPLFPFLPITAFTKSPARTRELAAPKPAGMGWVSHPCLAASRFWISQSAPLLRNAGGTARTTSLPAGKPHLRVRDEARVVLIGLYLALVAGQSRAWPFAGAALRLADCPYAHRPAVPQALSAGPSTAACAHVSNVLGIPAQPSPMPSCGRLAWNMPYHGRTLTATPGRAVSPAAGAAPADVGPFLRSTSLDTRGFTRYTRRRWGGRSSSEDQPQHFLNFRPEPQGSTGRCAPGTGRASRRDLRAAGPSRASGHRCGGIPNVLGVAPLRAIVAVAGDEGRRCRRCRLPWPWRVETIF